MPTFAFTSVSGGGAETQIRATWATPPPGAYVGLTAYQWTPHIDGGDDANPNWQMIDDVWPAAGTSYSHAIARNSWVYLAAAYYDQYGNPLQANYTTTDARLCWPRAPYGFSSQVNGKQVTTTFSKDDRCDLSEVDTNRDGSYDFFHVGAIGNTTDSISFYLPSYSTQYVLYFRSYNPDSRIDANSAWAEHIVTTGSDPTPSRPTNFAWNGEKIPGAIPFFLSDNEWNAFTTKINAFRRYKGLADATFTPATDGGNIMAAMFNQARNAIAAMNPPTAPPAVVIGVSEVEDPNDATDITADGHLNLIVSSLNSIP